jgi:tryptophan halogenase
MQLFPFNGIQQTFVDHYNETARAELEKIRDFIVLHYVATERDDSPFWRHCRKMELPETLARRIEMFRQSAHAWQSEGELFRVDSWSQVMIGQGIRPEHYHHSTKGMSDQDLRQFMTGLKASIRQTVDKMPTHQDFLDRYCKSGSDMRKAVAS